MHFRIDAAHNVHLPAFITCAKDAAEDSEACAIFDGIPGARKSLFLPKIGGVHGSSTLGQDRNTAGASENWKAVTAFLGQLHLPPS